MKRKNIGNKGENTETFELVSLIKQRGFQDASFERIFKIIDPITRKPTSRKPDIVFSNGGVNIVSAKIGESLERQAVSSAYSYLRDLASVTTIGEVFAVTYPKPGEKFHLHVLPFGDREEISLVLNTMEQVANIVVDIVHGRLADLAEHEETTENEARRILQYTALELADSLTGVSNQQLETVFGGHDFFRSVFQKVFQKSLKKGKDRKKALRMGAAFLFINQILFYTLLSQSAKRAGTPELYPEIETLDRSDPEILQKKYFDKVKTRDYEPIYGIGITKYFKASSIGAQLAELIDTLSVLISKLRVSELVGQIFQSIIPFELRKPLGAHYTNPNAAHLLATIAIDSFDAKIMDPACGSGTLLVASYRQKMKLAGKSNPKLSHKQFVEQDITGIDAMAFSSHLAAVNLALQQPLYETDYVRIGTEDSTRYHPGDTINPTSDLWAEELTQVKISHKFEAVPPKSSKTIRVPSLTSQKTHPIELKQVDVVIMNPPFTSQNNLAENYRKSLKKRFSISPTHKQIAFWKTSQQVYFILLADRFLKKGGVLAAVLPLTTFTGHAFHPLVNFLTEKYTVKSIVVGLGQSSYSEDTSLTECLFVASKTPPKNGSVFRLLGTKIPPSLWTNEVIEELSNALTKDKEQRNNDKYISKIVPERELAPDRQTLSLIYLKLNSDFEKAWTTLERVFSKSQLKMRRIKDWFNDGLEMNEVYHGEDRPLVIGPKAIIMCRSAERAIKDIDRLILKAEKNRSYTFFDRFSDESEYEFPKSELTPALRRFPFLDSMDITDKTDFCVKRPGETTEKAMRAFYDEKESKDYLKRLKDESWLKILERGSSKIAITARADLAAPGTRLIAVYSEKPIFLAGAYGYTVTGFKDETGEKLFMLWMNSTLALLQLIAKSTITRGSWVKLEEFTTEQVILPDVSTFTSLEKNRIHELWNAFSKLTFPSLLVQLKSHGNKRQLDVALLELLGLPKREASELAETIEKGALAAI